MHTILALDALCETEYWRVGDFTRWAGQAVSKLDSLDDWLIIMSLAKSHYDVGRAFHSFLLNHDLSANFCPFEEYCYAKVDLLIGFEIRKFREHRLSRKEADLKIFQIFDVYLGQNPVSFDYEDEAMVARLESAGKALRHVESENSFEFLSRLKKLR